MPKKPSKAASHFDTLFGVQQGEQLAGGFKLIARDKIERSAQPRQSFPAAEISELAHSIAALHERGEGIQGTGILQPLLVTQNGTGYQLLAGERRYRASAQAGIEQLPVIVMDTNENGILLAQLVENLQRRDLPPLEEARGIGQLMSEQNVSLREAARLLGKGKGYIENRVNLLKMRPDVQEMVSVQTDTLLHARDIEAVSDPQMRATLIRAVLEEGISRAELRRRIEDNHNTQAQQKAWAQQKTRIQQNAQAQVEASNKDKDSDEQSRESQTNTGSQLSVRTDSHRTAGSTTASSATSDSATSKHKRDDSSRENATQGSYGQSSGSSDDTSTQDDPLTSTLSSAVKVTAEFGRQLQAITLTYDYRQAVTQELAALKHQIALIEKRLESKDDA